MTSTTLAIIREEKIPPDTRTPLSPAQARLVVERFPGTKVICQSSEYRCFHDDEYKAHGIPVVDDLSAADILLGVKEVSPERFIPGKTYLIFSHTIKKQAHNRSLLQAAVEKKITLIDYECLTDSTGIRVIAFGRWAGIAGAFNAFWTFGKKYDLFSMRRAYECTGLSDIRSELKNVFLPPIKIVLTGNGRVAMGVLEILNALKIRKVDPEQYLFQQFDEPVFAQIDADVYAKRKDGKRFSFQDFFNHPEAYETAFAPFCRNSDMLIMAAYWNPAAPVLFEPEDIRRDDFRIRVIADITCDINGSVPTTIRPTTIEAPVYDFDVQHQVELPAFSAKKQLSVMAVDNLPNELPGDASESFGAQLIEMVLPALLRNSKNPMIRNATITWGGTLTEKFEYLTKYLEGGE